MSHGYPYYKILLSTVINTVNGVLARVFGSRFWSYLVFRPMWPLLFKHGGRKPPVSSHRKSSQGISRVKTVFYERAQRVSKLLFFTTRK